MEEFCYHIKKASRQKGSKAPPIPLPIVMEPFQQVVMDIVEPLPRALSGNRYILVMSDYTTRYPEGVPGAGIGSQEVPAEIIILGKFLDVMSSIPGCTTEVEHKVTTTGTRPVRLTSYQLPHAYRDLVEREIKEMLDAGVIEPSLHEWASPVVLVGKKDGALRLCVDDSQ